jgi:hypothetical protein
MIRKLKVIVYFRKVFLLSRIFMRKVPSISGYVKCGKLTGDRDGHQVMAKAHIAFGKVSKK